MRLTLPWRMSGRVSYSFYPRVHAALVACDFVFVKQSFVSSAVEHGLDNFERGIGSVLIVSGHSRMNFLHVGAQHRAAAGVMQSGFLALPDALFRRFDVSHCLVGYRLCAKIRWQLYHRPG